MRYLKQSAQVTKLVGPCLDKTDGVTEEAGLAGAGTEISKDGAAFAAGPVLGTHDSDGWYPVVLTTTHTNTIGDLLLKIHDAATHLPVWVEFHVLAANVYDSLFGAGTDKLDVNVEEWNTTAVPAEHTVGYPIVTVKDGAGTGEINTNAGAIALVDLVTTTTTVTNQLTAAAIATGVWQDATAGDFTVASSIGKALYIANVVPGAAGGHFISGSNAGTTTVGALTVTGATTLTGAVSLGSTLGVTGTATFAAVTTTGTVTMNALTVSNATTLSGAVSLGGTLGVTGTVTFNAFTVTNALTVSGNTTFTGTTTHTGNVSMAAGLTITQSTTDAHAVQITGNGVGSGIRSDGGATAGHGAMFFGTGGGDGMICSGVIGFSDAGSSSGINASGAGGATGVGIAAAGGTSGYGIQGTGGAAGIRGLGSTNGVGAWFLGAGTGHGFRCSGGATSGDGVHILGGLNAGNGLHIGGSAGGGLAVNIAGVGANAGIAISGTPGVSVDTIATTGLVTLHSLTVSNTTTLSGAVSLGSTLGVTGAITATNASNNVRLGTFTVDTNAIAWNAAWDTEVQSEVQDAIEANHLDHLFAVADPGGIVANSSLWAALTSKSATPAYASYVNTTDSLEALRDRGDTAWVTATGFSTHTAADVWTSVTRTLTAATNITSTGATTVPQTGDSFARLGLPAGASVSADVAAVKVDTAAILDDTGTAGVIVAAASKTGYALSATGLDAIAVTDPGAPGSHTTLPKMVVALWRWFYKKTTLTSTQLKTYADNGTSVNGTATVSDDATTQTKGELS